MKTQEQIMQRIRELHGKDLFGFETTDLMYCLTPVNALTLGKELGMFHELDMELFEKECIKSEEQLREIMVNYMAFAWDKANNKRGLSASRSLAHYSAWLWVYSDEDWSFLDEYHFYGKDHLVKICEFLGLDAGKWDDGVREDS